MKTNALQPDKGCGQIAALYADFLQPLDSERLTLFEQEFLVRLQAKQLWSEQEQLVLGWIAMRHLPQMFDAINLSTGNIKHV